MNILGCQSGIQSDVKIIKSRAAFIGYATLPAEDTQLKLLFNGLEFRVSIGANYCEEFRSNRIVYAINKDNSAKWVSDWAKFYVSEHDADSVVIFDNKSKHYKRDQLENALGNVVGLKHFRVIEWPFKFGALDPIAQQLNKPFYTMFAQPVAHMELYLRYGYHAKSILNVDIDELVLSKKGRSVFRCAESRFFWLR